MLVQVRAAALRSSLTQEPSGPTASGASPRTSGRVRSLRCSASPCPGRPVGRQGSSLGQTKRPQVLRPRTRVDVSRGDPPTRRITAAWSPDRLTGRPMRPCRAIVDLLIRGHCPLCSEDGRSIAAARSLNRLEICPRRGGTTGPKPGYHRSGPIYLSEPLALTSDAPARGPGAGCCCRNRDPPHRYPRDVCAVPR
jgi:hypothetical protein